MQISFALRSDYGIGSAIRTTFNLAQQHDVEITSVLGHRDEPVFQRNPRVRVRHPVDIREDSPGCDGDSADRAPARIFPCGESRHGQYSALTDRRIAKSPGTFMDKAFDLAYVFERRPRFIVLAFFGVGEANTPFEANAALHPFTEMERRLGSHPEFARRYFRDSAAESAPSGDLDRLRWSLGAEALFPYATPGRRYVLAVYRRRA